jgi:hypothetical protein
MCDIQLEVFHRKVGRTLIHLVEVRHGRVSIDKHILGTKASELNKSTTHYIIL